VPSFLTCGPDFFPGWISLLFSAGLALGVAHHLPCLISSHGSRWFHAGHTAMALSMIYMYLSMSSDWNWLPASWQMWFFVATSAVITAWLAAKIIRGQPVNFLWMLLLIQQAAMAYMWYPMMRWNAIAIFVLVSWFAIEAFGWTADLLPDDVRITENRRWLPYEIGRKAGASAFLPAATADAGNSPDCDCHSTGHLTASDWKDRALMAVMALSMGYMFYGMQLLR
jgi:hypothetical protein